GRRGEGAGSGGPRLLPLHLLLRPERHPAGADVRHSRLRARGRGGRRRGRQGLEPPHGPPGDRRPLAGRSGGRSPAMVRKGAIVLLVAAGLGALLVPLGGTGAGGDPYRIGALLIVSGRGRFYGEVMHRGIEMAVEEINRAGGVKGRKLEVVV